MRRDGPGQRHFVTRKRESGKDGTMGKPHSIHCQGYRGTGHEFDDEACDCEASTLDRRAKPMKPFLINTAKTRLAIRATPSPDGPRAWLMAGSDCLLTPMEADRFARWLMEWSDEAVQAATGEANERRHSRAAKRAGD